MDIRQELTKPFKENELEWRTQACGITNNKAWVRVLVYVQARAIQERLDNVFGWENWTDEYREVNGNVICRLGVYYKDRWIYKENGASQTEIESFKGGISGALKRVAASGFGIGRYLYNITEQFAECTTIKTAGFTEKAKTRNKEVIYWKIPRLYINKNELQRVCILQKEAGLTDEIFKDYLKNDFGIDSRKLITPEQYKIIIDLLQRKIQKNKLSQAV